MDLSFRKKEVNDNASANQPQTPEQDKNEIKGTHHRTVSKDSSVRGGGTHS